MNKLKITFLSVLAVTVAFAVTAYKSGKSSKAPKVGFAVVELFTSEGCSSCPPADALVSRIQKEDADQPVYILAFHVDYWNRLGWRDPYSAAVYSQRQSKYSRWMHSSSVYTPQIVVNGRKEFIGSEEGTLRNAIKSAEQISPDAGLHFMNVKADGSRITYEYQTDHAGNNTSLVVALVQKAAKTEVKAGENSGRTLSHVQIVRQLQSINLKSANGSGSIDFPKNIGKDAEIVAFLQNDTNGQILAATRSEISGAAL